MRTRSIAKALALPALLVSSAVQPIAAQPAADRINIYRYILDVDPPESPGLVALDATPAHVLRGAAPKPIAAALVHRFTRTGWATGGAVDIVPYYLLGGGIRERASYRANSVAGRLMRVVTKTALSAALLAHPDAPGQWRGAIALRTTFHDPHDPIVNFRLPELVDSALAANGIRETDPTVEDLADRPVDLKPIFAQARRAMRARGDVQVSAGWGVAGDLDGAALSSDSLTGVRHTLWLSAQHATGHRADILFLAQMRNAFHRDDALRFGLGLQRKSRPADFRAELYYDWANRRLHPGLSAELHAGPGWGAVLGLTSEAPATSAKTPSRVSVTLLGRWYPTAER
ncbi:MAG: hypothetical protein ACKVZ0_20360 [Gemmatimonadales bacterium]